MIPNPHASILQAGSGLSPGPAGRIYCPHARTGGVTYVTPKKAGNFAGKAHRRWLGKTGSRAWGEVLSGKMF